MHKLSPAERDRRIIRAYRKALRDRAAYAPHKSTHIARRLWERADNAVDTLRAEYGVLIGSRHDRPNR